MEHIRQHYETSRQRYRAAFFRFLAAWTALYGLLVVVIWQVIRQLPPPGTPLNAQFSHQLPLWGLGILSLLGIALIQSRMRDHAASRLEADRKAYEKNLKDLLAIARENGDTRGVVEAETELQRLNRTATR